MIPNERDIEKDGTKWKIYSFICYFVMQILYLSSFLSVIRVRVRIFSCLQNTVAIKNNISEDDVIIQNQFLALCYFDFKFD